MNQNNDMHENLSTNPEESDKRGWLVPLALAVGFLLWGLLIFATVKVKWPPPWNFGAMQDVPGLSEYSSGGRNPLPTVASPFLHEKAELTPQHVRSVPRPESSHTPLERQP